MFEHKPTKSVFSLGHKPRELQGQKSQKAGLYLDTLDTPSFKMSDKDFDEISQVVLKLTGIVLRQEKKAMVYARLAKRLRELKFTSFQEYRKFISSSEGEREITNLINAITTNLTRFFREDHHFTHLKNTLGDIFTNRENITRERKRLRIWSAGCSSGEEPYSIAMTLLSSGMINAGIDVKILATDIDTNMLRHAEQGVYKSGQGLLPEMSRYYSSSSTGEVKISNEAKRLVTFKQLNLLSNWPMRGPFDIVFCRNVVIYFNKETQKELFGRIHNLIIPNGWLYIGHSENLYRVSDGFSLKGKTIYQKVS